MNGVVRLRMMAQCSELIDRALLLADEAGCVLTSAWLAQAEAAIEHERDAADRDGDRDA